MTFEEARSIYATHASRNTVRDRAIIQTIHHDMGIATCSLLVIDSALAGALRDLFVDAVQSATKPVEAPAGVKVTQTPSGPVTHVDLDHRLKAEVRKDGHTYIGDERID